MLVAALTSGQKIGIACVGVAFILFALVCSFVIPRRSPNFPGRHVGWFVVLCIAFVVAMLSAVIVFGKEKEEPAGAAESPPAQSTSTPATSTPAPTTTSSGGGGAPAVQGNAVAGKAVFTSAGCSGCHTLKAAHSSGTVGPNLDQLKPDYDTIEHQVENGGGGMPAFKGQLSPAQINNVSAFVFTSTHA
jgi:mono/diheme cytochrome c family protein